MSCPDPDLQDTVSFAASAVTTLILKRPEKGNTESIDLNIIPHRSRSDKLFLYKRNSPVTVLDLRFRGLTTSEHDDVDTFFTASAGKLITYTDHQNTAWTGFVPNYRWTQEADEKGWSLDFNFEVE